MTTKPILKWLGGKTQILPKINEIIQNNLKEVHNYYEIFLGGGSTLFNFLNLIKNEQVKLTGQVYAYDINASLIYVYKNIQDNYNEVFTHLQELITNFNSLPETKDKDVYSREKYYYDIRKFYNELSNENKQSSLSSAVFIFLNKTCFRGMYREGPHGFNVPYGNYKNPEIGNLKHFEEVSELIKDVIFEVKSFEESINEISCENDFAYLDPPYAPENSTSFTNYTKDGFTLFQHETLFESLKTAKFKFLLSNADVPLVNDSFSNSGKFKIETIKARRSINSKNPEATTSEVLIYNF